MFASWSTDQKVEVKTMKNHFRWGCNLSFFDSLLNIEMAVLSHGNVKMVIDHHLISIAHIFLYKTLFELLPSSLGKSWNAQETGVHLFGKKKNFWDHRNQLAQTDDVDFLFTARASFSYQWNTYLAKRKRIPITFPSNLAYVYSSLFDLLGCHN